jgi:type II secretory pathway pseudopilin PulG
MEGDDLPEAVRDFMKNSVTSSLKGQLAVAKVLPEGYLVNNHTTGSGLESMILAGSIAPVGILASMLLPALAKAKQRANTIKSVNNIKQLNMGLIAYANDNRGQLPPANRWCDAILRNVGTVRVFPSPRDHGPQHAQMVDRVINAGQNYSSYALNSAVAGRNINTLHPSTVLLLEYPIGWNGVGTSQQLIQYIQSKPSLRGVAVVGLVDGSAMQGNLQTLRTLRWTP